MLIFTERDKEKKLTNDLNKRFNLKDIGKIILFSTYAFWSC